MSQGQCAMLNDIKEWAITWLHIIGGAILVGVIVYVVVVYLYPIALNIGITIGRNL